MNKHVVVIAVVVVGLSLYAAHTLDLVGFIRAMHGR